MASVLEYLRPGGVWAAYGEPGGLTRAQWDTLRALWVILRPAILHHEGTLGAAAQCNYIASRLGFPVMVHPPTGIALQIDPRNVHPHAQVLPPENAPDRYRAMIYGCDIILFLPEEEPPRRWRPLEEARRQGRTRLFILADGSWRHSKLARPRLRLDPLLPKERRRPAANEPPPFELTPG